MRSGLSEGDLAAVWHRFVHPIGDSAELRIASRVQKPGFAVRVLQLAGSQGSVRTQFAIDGSTGEVAGLYFLPARR